MANPVGLSVVALQPQVLEGRLVRRDLLTKRSNLSVGNLNVTSLRPSLGCHVPYATPVGTDLLSYPPLPSRTESNQKNVTAC